jgi:hypothetical protein
MTGQDISRELDMRNITVLRAYVGWYARGKVACRFWRLVSILHGTRR